MRYIPISPNTFLNKKSQVEQMVYILVCINKENSPVKTALLPFFGCRRGANVDEMNENVYKTNFRVPVKDFSAIERPSSQLFNFTQ